MRTKDPVVIKGRTFHAVQALPPGTWEIWRAGDCDPLFIVRADTLTGDYVDQLGVTYDMAFERGRSLGQQQKAHEIRRVLGI